MIVLGLETSGTTVSYALVSGDELLIEHTVSRPHAASEALLSFVDRGLADVGLSKGAIDGIAVTHGPGSFTGVRVGLAAAQGLALGLDRPLVTVSTLDAVLAAIVPQPGLAVAALDARRGEVYVAAAREVVQADGGVPLVLEAFAAAPEAAAARIAAALAGSRDAAVVAGSGAGLLAAALASYADVRVCCVPSAVGVPRAAVVACLGARRLAAGGAVTPEAAGAEYLRDANALTTAARRAREAAAR